MRLNLSAAERDLASLGPSLSEADEAYMVGRETSHSLRMRMTRLER